MRDAHFHLDCYPTAELPHLLEKALGRGVSGGLIAGVWTEGTRRLLDWAREPESVAPALRFARTGEGALAPAFGECREPTISHFLVFMAHGLHPACVGPKCLAPALPPASKDPLEEGRASCFGLGSGNAQSPASRAEENLETHLLAFRHQLESGKQWIQAIGETGFDLHPQVLAAVESAGLTKADLVRLQRRAFDACVEAALAFGLPLVIHSRGAWAVTLAAVREAREKGVSRIMFHCYGGPAEDVPGLAREGFFLSFGGVPTWARAKKVREAFLRCPLENLLVETDGPDLPLEFEDGTRPARHEPEHLADVMRRLADLRGARVEDFALKVDRNLDRFLGLR